MEIDAYAHFINRKDYIKELLIIADECGIDKICLSPLPPQFDIGGSAEDIMKVALKYS